MYKEALAELVSKLHGSDEVVLVKDMIIKSGIYVQKVIAHEAQIITKPANSPEEYRQHVAEADVQRSIAHNSLISSVAIVNRLCKSVGSPSIFCGNIGNRVEVAEFAFDLVKEIFESRRL